MIRKVIFRIFFLLLFFKTLNAQNEATYLGAIKLNDSSLITYKINLKENNGKVTGYSITDLGGDHETRSNLFGEFDNHNNELNLRETGIVYTKSEVDDTYDFCFVNTTFKNFKFNRSKNINAPFLGLFSDNTECISGELLLTLQEKVEKRLKRVSKVIERSNALSDSIKDAVNPIKIMEHRNNTILKKGQILNVFSNNPSVTLYIYDAGEVDSDKIQLTVNSELILKEFTAKKDKKELQVPLKTLVTSIQIKALNEGDLGKNTVRVLIKDGGDDKTIRVMTSLNKGDVATVKIHKNSLQNH